MMARTSSHSAGPRRPIAAPGNNIPVLLQLQRAGWGSSRVGEDSRSMAPADDNDIVFVDDDATETEAVPGSAERDDNPSSKTSGSSRWLAASPNGHQPRDPAAGQDHPLQAMGPPKSAAQDHQQDPGELTEDVSALPGAPGHVCRQQPGPEVPLIAHVAATPGDSMEVADVDTCGHTIPVAQPPGVLSGVDSGCHKLEATQPPTECPVHQFGAEPRATEEQRQREGQRKRQVTTTPEEEDLADQAGNLKLLAKESLVPMLQNLVLENPNNLCYANAALYALAWTLLAMSTYEPVLWGEQCTDLILFLESARNRLGNLTQAKFYQSIVRCMGLDEIPLQCGTISQQDSAEYVQQWLEMLQTSAFDMSWEKRFEAAGTVQTMDTHPAQTTPLCLKFDEISVQCSLCSLSTLIRVWHQADGMSSALLRAPPCLCIHLDRCAQGPNLEIYKCTSRLDVEDECFFPVFNDDSLSSTSHGYHIVALMSHLGADGAGHYRAALRVKPTIAGLTSPVGWMLTDDWRRPEPQWNPPNWMRENVTLIWLVRTDLLSLPLYQPQPDQTGSSMTALMQLLTTDPANPMDKE